MQISQEEYQEREREFLVQVLDRAAADDEFRQLIAGDPSLAFEDPQLAEAGLALVEPLQDVANIMAEVDEKELELSSKLLDRAATDEEFRSLLLSDPDAAIEEAGLADEHRALVASRSVGDDSDVEAHWTPAVLVSVRFCAAIAGAALSSAQKSCLGACG